MIAVGDWVIYERGCSGYSPGEVLYVDKHFVVIQTGGLAFDVASSIRFVGNRKQVAAMLRKLDEMRKARHEAIKAAEAKVQEVRDEHMLAIRELFKQQERAE